MRSKTPLVLMEQLLMILVFALAAAMCLQIFVHADRRSRRNEAVSQAAVQAQNTAEMIKSRGGTLSETLELADGWVQENRTWMRAFEVNWQPVQQEISQAEKKISGADDAEEKISGAGETKENISGADDTGEYRITVHEEETKIPGLLRARIVVSQGSENLFEIPVAWQEVSGHE